MPVYSNESFVKITAKIYSRYLKKFVKFEGYGKYATVDGNIRSFVDLTKMSSIDDSYRNRRFFARNHRFDTNGSTVTLSPDGDTFFIQRCTCNKCKQ